MTSCSLMMLRFYYFHIQFRVYQHVYCIEKKNNYFKHVHDINVESQIKNKIACIDSSRRPVVMPNRTCTCII